MKICYILLCHEPNYSSGQVGNGRGNLTNLLGKDDYCDSTLVIYIYRITYLWPQAIPQLLTFREVVHPECLLPRLVGKGDEGLHHHPLLTLDQGQHWSCYRRATDGVRNTVLLERQQMPSKVLEIHRSGYNKMYYHLKLLQLLKR